VAAISVLVGPAGQFVNRRGLMPAPDI
jgi:hypothetical protein